MDPSPQFSARRESRDGVGRLALDGELDIYTVPHLEEQLALLESDGLTALVLDLRGLTFLDSAGLQAFVDARLRAETDSHELIIEGASPRAQRLFELTNLESLLQGQDPATSHEVV